MAVPSPLPHSFRDALKALVGADFTGRRYLCAVSGGIDSMVLLHLMAKEISAENLIVAHYNHGLRGQASDGDEALVQETAFQLGLTLVREKGPGDARSEAAMRKQRLAFLERSRREQCAEFIVTAHQAEDQLETFLMRCLRGTGADGLSAIAPRRAAYLRPLLKVSRSKLLEYANREAIKFREDASNQSHLYFRNRVRHLLLPTLFELSETHGGREVFLSRFAEMLEELRETSLKTRRRARKWYTREVWETPLWIVLARKAFLRSSTEREVILRRIFSDLNAEVPDRVTVAQLMLDLKAGRKAGCLPGKITFRSSCGYLFFQNETQRQLEKKTVIFEASPSGMVCPELGMRITLAPSWAGLQLRFPRPGDRYRNQKLKREFLVRRIPAPERRLIPVLTEPDASQILWCFPDESSAVKVENLDFAFSFSRA